jgi:hypothetical protein
MGVTLGYIEPMNKNTTAMIEIKDPADKNNILVFRKTNQPAGLQPVGIIHCFCATEWEAIGAAGNHIGWFISKKEALKSLVA